MSNTAMIPPVLHMGPVTLSSYGVIISIAVGISYFIARKRAYIYQLSPQLVDDFLLLVVAFSVLGARLYHVLDEWHYYSANISEIIAIWHGGIGIYGAIFGGIFGLFLFARKRNLSLLQLLDLVAPSALLGQAIGRIGNYINQEAFGGPTQLPWSIFIAEDKRPWFWRNETQFHPTFLYEMLLNLLGFTFLLFVAKRQPKPGTVFAWYLILYGIARVITEQFRFDTAMFGSMKVATFLSIFFIFWGIVVLRFKVYK